ncbi:venom carboxylesterase-6-like isoform X2 [Photinus pyralis]|uniref:venom carboxylesterase-6-like isoform X2 n=1 Tax=Photinus pyralis TaxID=7054 RepID=UPI00126744C2|nr:venom carboxylesterase-6-like isoform X2 [Photinus pyralis]
MPWPNLIKVILLLVPALNSKNYSTSVSIKQGTLEGSVRKTWGGRTIFAFQGIPYAEPPIGNRRFQPPLPAQPWEGVLNATKSHPFCPQSDVFRNDLQVYGKENCLFLNVYAPNVTDEQYPLPVIVFIHGGGFISDSGNPELYGPDILLDKDLVLVTVNYRLGALGFLSLEDDILPGNNGLKDQNIALLWVRDNIESFGGDPGKITIFGNSAGGASVYYHILSPLSRGLFHATISSSGIATSPWALAKPGEGRAAARKLAKSLNCSASSSEEIVKCLQGVDAHDIVRLVQNLMEFHYECSIPHRPVIEPKNPGAFISDHPIDIIKSGEFSQVPYMLGLTANDGALKSAAIYANHSLVERLNNEFEDIVPIMLFYGDQNFKQRITAIIRKFYFNDRSIGNDTKSELTDVLTDGYFYYPQRATSEIHAKYSSQPVYFYLFGYKGTLRASAYFGDPTYDYGVCHCDDLNYILNHQYMSSYRPTEADLKMNNLMTTLLYNFAKTGKPTPEITSVLKTQWKALKDNEFRYYSIIGPDDVTMRDRLFEDRYNFWKKLDIYPKLQSEGEPISNVI